MDYDLNRRGWHWAATEFANGLKYSSSYPMSYLYGVWLSLSGHMIGRRLWIDFPRRMYPNFYNILIGPSAQGRKTTAMWLGYEGIRDLMQYTSPPLSTVTTQQGLLQNMADNGGHTLVMLDELSSMTAKGKMDFGRDLMQRLVELYDCPPVATTATKNSPVTVYDPFLSILAASTSDWVQSTVGTDDLLGGIGNRFTFILGDERKVMPRPGTAVHSLDWTLLALPSGQLLLAEDCNEVWDSYYIAFDTRQRNSPPLLRVMAQRLPEKVLKTAMIMAAWNNEPYISGDTLEMALDWGDYLYDCILSFMPTFEDVEKQVFVAIQEGSDSHKSLYTTLRHKHSTGRIQKALKNLAWMGAITDSGGYYATIVDNLDELEAK